LLFFGPILLPKAIGYYRSIRAAPSIHGIPIRPLPAAVLRALTILFITALVFLGKTLSSPENVFSLTKSRLQIPIDVLLARIASLRPNGLTPYDELLRTRLKSLESRLIYLQFGPDAILDCEFCSPEDPKWYLYYSLPAILAPHLFNLCVLGLVTSGLFTGREGAVWRTTATLTALAVALLDIYFVSSYNYQGNSLSTGVENLDFFFWKMRVYRGIAIAAIDGVIGWVLYLSSTNRAFLNPPSTAERVEMATRTLDIVRTKLTTLGILKNTIIRDEDLMSRSQVYWGNEVKLMGDVMEEREVVEGVRNALDGRINMATIMADAETYAHHAVTHLQGGMQGMNGNI
jgi:hypothetical protein